MLARFAGLPLLDKYDVYQCLMDYWSAVMQDDIDIIAAEGWVAGAKPRGIIEGELPRARGRVFPLRPREPRKIKAKHG